MTTHWWYVDKAGKRLTRASKLPDDRLAISEEMEVLAGDGTVTHHLLKDAAGHKLRSVIMYGEEERKYRLPWIIVGLLHLQGSVETKDLEDGRTVPVWRDINGR